MNAHRFDLPTVQALVAYYAKLQGLAAAGWTLTTEIVPGLQHNGEDAWAVVDSDPKAKTAAVSVRDLAATPIPGVADPWHELKVTVSHELWHPWVTLLLAEPTVENEEALVEAAAQAVVCSAGAEARVMARSIQAIPAAVRARVAKVSARVVRARGGQMDPKLIAQALDALIAGDLAKCAEILKGLVGSAAAAGAGGAGGAGASSIPPPPASSVEMGAREVPPPAMGDPKDPKEGADSARKARMAMEAEDKALRARQVHATTEIEQSAGVLRGTTIRARIHEARTVDKATISAEAEKLILASPSIGEAEIRLTLARGSAATTTQRARAVGADGAPLVIETVVDAEAPNLDGLGAQELELYHRLATSSPAAAKQYAGEAQKVRGRIVAAQKGAAS